MIGLSIYCYAATLLRRIVDVGIVVVCAVGGKRAIVNRPNRLFSQMAVQHGAAAGK